MVYVDDASADIDAICDLVDTLMMAECPPASLCCMRVFMRGGQYPQGLHCRRHTTSRPEKISSSSDGLTD